MFVETVLSFRCFGSTVTYIATISIIGNALLCVYKIAFLLGSMTTRTCAPKLGSSHMPKMTSFYRGASL